MTTPVRIGAVPYLNAVPLVYSLEQAPPPEYELTYAEPSVLAEQLQAGDIDVGLIPVMEYLAGVGECVVPDVSISSRGPARSVKLFANKPWGDVRIVAAHSASRSSAAMASVLLQEQYGQAIELRRAAPDVAEMLRSADAAMLIGDPCLQATDVDVRHKVDLGAVWDIATGLPFVYAVWVSASEEPPRALAETLQDAKRSGVRAIPEIARREAGHAGLSAGQIERYLRVDLNYDLTPGHIDGIRRFAELCVQHGLLEEARDIRFAWRP
jgi:chorismate dehydratase